MAFVVMCLFAGTCRFKAVYKARQYNPGSPLDLINKSFIVVTAPLHSTVEYCISIQCRTMLPGFIAAYFSMRHPIVNFH